MPVTNEVSGVRHLRVFFIKQKKEVFYPLLSPCLQGEGQIRRLLIRLISFGSGVTG